jgi:hypothetical protein
MRGDLSMAKSFCMVLSGYIHAGFPEAEVEGKDAFSAQNGQVTVFFYQKTGFFRGSCLPLG